MAVDTKPFLLLAAGRFTHYNMALNTVTSQQLDHIFYHRCMIEYFEKEKNSEPSSLPLKPKQTVTFLEGGEREKRTDC